MPLRLQPCEFLGQRRRLLQLPTLRLTETSYDASQRLARHAHATASFCLVLVGEFEEATRRESLHIRARQVLFRPADAPHADSFGPLGGRCLNAEFSDAQLSGCGAQELTRGEARRFAGGAVPQLMRQMRREWTLSDSATPLALQGLACELLAGALRAAHRREDVPRWLTRVRDLLHERFAEHHELAALAHEAGVHASHLCRTFRLQFRSSPGEYLRRRRVEFAVDRLLGTDEALASVAVDAGFADQSQFTRTFRRLVGTTPAAFRAAARRNSAPLAQRIDQTRSRCAR